MARLALNGARRWAQTPLALRIAVIYLAARIVTALFLIAAASLSTPASRFGADPEVADLTVGWDAQWYWFLAENGYPAELPRTDSGAVAENAWAFMPIFAFAAKAVGVVFGSWGFGAFLVSFVSGYFACLALHRLLRDRIGRSASTWAVAFFACSPLAAMFHVGYAESLFLLLLFVALDMTIRRRYLALYFLIPAMAFTRPGILAFALYLGLHAVQRWLRRREDPLSVRDAVTLVVLGALAVSCGFGWQVIAGVVTGDPGAYLATELAWRRIWIAGTVTEFVPFEGWVRAAQFWFGLWGLPELWGLVVAGLLVIGAGAALVFSRYVRAVGSDLRLWTASYLLYLLAVFFPQSSTFRLLLPVSPLWGSVAVPRSTPWRVSVVTACIAGQWVWIYHIYALGNTFWQVP